LPEADTAVSPPLSPAAAFKAGPVPTPEVENPVRAFIPPQREAFYRLLQGQLQTSETARNHYVARPEAAVTREQMLRPAFWSHVAKMLRAGDRIDALSADASWFMELVVRASDGVEVAIGELRFVAFDAIAQRNPDDYEIAYKGPVVRWRITRKADGVIVQENLQSKLAAEAWLASPLIDK
jgi:hypothetical protein